MKLGDIKIEALKLMFVSGVFDIGIADLPNMMSDENYGSYLVSMNGSISRAIDRVQNACIVPLKVRVVASNEKTKGIPPYETFDLAQIPDLYVLDRVIEEYSTGGYDGNAEYSLVGNSIMLNAGNNHTILYYPLLKAIDETVGDDSEINLPDYIARLIPYYVKSELYQDEEPQLAADARNIFEMSLDDLKKNRQSNQTRVRRIIHY